jgi:pyridoxine 4-dehydrogenase
VTGNGKSEVNGSRFWIGGDLEVSRLGFGAMRITGPGVWGPPLDRDEALRVLRRIPDLGINLIDTADSYGPFVSEELIAAALYPYPKDLIIATKAGYVRAGPDLWRPYGRPDYLRERCEGSLRRLRLDRIDLFQLHRVDPQFPLVDQVGTLKDLQDEGKIRYVGLSEVSVAQIEAAQEVVRIVSVQNRYNLWDRRHEKVLRYCERNRIAFLPWAPLAAGPLNLGEGQLARIGGERGVTPAQLALAWLLHRSPVMIPIPGTARVNHLEENAAAAGIELDPAEVRDLSRSIREHSRPWIPTPLKLVGRGGRRIARFLRSFR